MEKLKEILITTIIFYYFFSLYSCNNVVSYYELPESLKSKEDSLTMLVYYCDKEQYDQAKKLYPVLNRIEMKNHFDVKDNLLKIEYQYINIPDSNYTSAELFAIGIYIDRKYEVQLRFTSNFLQKSYVKDTSNYMALIEICKTSLLSNNDTLLLCYTNLLSKQIPYQKKYLEQIIEIEKTNSFQFSDLDKCDVNFSDFKTPYILQGTEPFNVDDYNKISYKKRSIKFN